MTAVEDFVSRRMTDPSITLSQSLAHGTRTNTTIALVGITGLPLKKEETYSRITTTCQGYTCTTISVDGVDMCLEVSLGTLSYFETLQQQMPTSTLGIMTSISYNSALVLPTLLALSALETEVLELFSSHVKHRNCIVTVLLFLHVSLCLCLIFQ